MRLCANVPAMLAVQTALGGKQSINDLVKPGGRLAEQRDLAYKLLTDIPGVRCVKPSSAMYLFFKLDANLYPIQDDENFVLQILKEKKLLLVQGSAFNYPDTQHLRLVFLPDADLLREAVKRLSDFLRDYLNQNSKVS
jgi:alanine-synthesizing transaminase